jgi:Protein of unknown function (DUF3224)
MPNHVTGPFDVKITPQSLAEAEADSGLGRMALNKQFHGELEATSVGEMLTAMSSSVQGSGAYVAVERVTGTLGGRSGSFALHHTGVMNRGVPQLTISVVPDSGTGELIGITGKLNIRIEAGGKHFYDFEYELPAQ